MALSDLLVSDVADVFLNTDDHARTIQVVAPKSVDAFPVTGVWDVSTENEVDMTRGKEVVYKATFAYAATVVIQAESSAVVDGITWVCLSPGASHAGLKTSHWQGRLRINTSANGAK